MTAFDGKRAPEPRISLTYAIPFSQGVLAVAAMNNQLFVTRVKGNTEPLSQVLVYNETTLELSYNITFPGATGPFYGLTVDPTSGQLFVSDGGNNTVYRVDLLSPFMVAKKAIVASPYGLSLNKLRNVIVTCTKGPVLEYTATGELVRQLTATNDLSLYHSIEVNNVTWAVSVTSQSRVCLLSISNTILSCYGTTGSGYDKLNYPTGLAVDKQGYIVVADQLNHRLVVLNRTLSEARNLTLPLNGTMSLKRPSALWLDQSRGRLYVGEGGGSPRVLVFDNVFSLYDVSTP